MDNQTSNLHRDQSTWEASLATGPAATERRLREWHFALMSYLDPRPIGFIGSDGALLTTCSSVGFVGTLRDADRRAVELDELIDKQFGKNTPFDRAVCYIAAIEVNRATGACSGQTIESFALIEASVSVA